METGCLFFVNPENGRWLVDCVFIGWNRPRMSPIVPVIPIP